MISDIVEDGHSELELKLRAECERGYIVGPAAVGPYSVTGETFTELCGGISHTEAAADIPFYPTAEAAYDAALVGFKAYAAGKTGTLYWRITPELQKSRKGWASYMRLLISDKPAIKKADAA